MLFVALNCSIVVLGHRQLSCFIEKQKIKKIKKGSKSGQFTLYKNQCHVILCDCVSVAVYTVLHRRLVQPLISLYFG